MKKGKSIISVILAVLMLLAAAPLAGFVGLDLVLKAEAYSVGDHIQYGTYPQTRVDETLELKVAAEAATWRSYKYYCGNGNSLDGTMRASNYMSFSDFMLGDKKYRAVLFKEYRPSWTGSLTSATDSEQDNNGYYVNTIYYFEYEPLLWIVLNPTSGLIVCEKIIDSQAFQSYVFTSNDDTWQDIAMTKFANSYATSTIREWLVNDFYESAFTKDQKNNILTTRLNNNCPFNSKYNSAETNDKVFLLSRDDVMNTSYGFSSSDRCDTRRAASGTDYAKCQGLYVHSNQNSLWWLRNPGDASNYACDVSYTCDTYYHNHVQYTSRGIRPACCLAELKNDTTVSSSLFSTCCNYQVGDLIQFGSYPQSQVENSEIISKLDSVYKTWKSYGYYSGTGSWYDGNMRPSDYMKYADFSYQDEKYRAVAFNKYRPHHTGYTPIESNTNQVENGYTINNVYYFKFEPIMWRVLNPLEGFVICDNIIDSQAFQNTCFYSNNQWWIDRAQENYVNNYPLSTIREWLNSDFFEIAFSDEQKVNISTSILDNKAVTSANYYTGNYETTNDRLFLISHADINNWSIDNNFKATSGTDYAKCQGLTVHGDKSPWMLRTGGYKSNDIWRIEADGSLQDITGVETTCIGVRPSCRLISLAKTEHLKTTTLTGTLESYLPQIDVENGGVWVTSVTIDGVTYPVQSRLLEDTLSGDINKTVTVELTNGVVTDIKISVGEAATGMCMIRSTSDSKDIEVPFEYWDDDFLQSSYVYNHNLAKMSLRLALSAFNSAEGSNYNKDDKSRNVRDLLGKCGFQSIEASDSYGEKPSADSIGVCFGSKEIGNSTLIAVAIRGGGYETEWAGNFEIGGDATHHGFAIAATKVQTEILKYFEQHTDLLSKKLKFWVVGYSRAGATANLVSAWLGSKPVDWQLEKKDIYAYTFEAPQPTTLANNNRNYDYIHNIVNPVDLVPKVVMSKWGYARYGKNMWLPSVSTTVNFSSPAYAQAIQDQMDAYLSAGNYTDGHPMIPLNAAHAPVLDILMDELASNLQNPNSDRTKLLSYLLQQLKLYENHAQTDVTKTDVYCYLYAVSIKHIVSSVIGKLVEGYSENKIIGSVAERISDTVIQTLTKNPDVTDGIGVMAAKIFLRIAELYSFKPRMLTMYDRIYTLTEAGKILANVGEIATCLMTPHFPELTLALLDSVDSLPEACGYRAVKVNCPVDVYAYNENGDVVAQIIDEQSIKEENQMIYSYVDEDGQKIIFLPDDADFAIKVIARDSGIMNYSVSEYDCNTGKTTQLVNYNDIPIQKGDVFNGEVPTVEADTDTIYTFSSSTSDVDLTETVLKGDQIIEYTVTVNAEGEGYVSGNSIKKYGEFVLVNAVPDKNSIFTGWFKDGKLVSADAEYRFRVDGDVTLTAKFMPHTHTYTSAISAEPTCTDDGMKTYTCSCGDSYAEPIPALGHIDEDNDGYCDREGCGEMMTGDDHCPQCGKIHNGGFFDSIVGFFHKIIYRLTHLFG